MDSRVGKVGMRAPRIPSLMAWLAIVGACASPAKGQLYPAGLVPAACAVPSSTNVSGILVDLDQDGDADLVGWSGAGPSLIVRLSAGGTLGAPVCYPTSQPGQSYILSVVAASDLDLDGDQDVVALVQGVSILLTFMNDGTGGFPAPPVITSMPLPVYYALDLGHLDGDAFPDVLLSTPGYPVQILLGTGVGTFLAPLAGPLPGTIFGPVVLKDDDLDGDDDLHEVSGTSFLTYRNNGAASFAPPLTRFTVASQYAIPAFGHVNGDGYPDAIVVGSILGPAPAFLQVALGNAAGTLTVGPAQPLLVTDSINWIATADFDGDGDADLLASTYSSGANSYSSGAFQSINTGGAFSPAVFVNKVPFSSIAVGDLANDGSADALFFTQAGYAALERGLPSTGLVHPNMVPGVFNPSGFHVTDLDADGRADVILAMPASPLLTTSTLSTILNVDTATGPSQTIATGASLIRDLATGDWNRDGAIDVLAAAYGTDLLMFAGSASGALQAPVTLPIGVAPFALVPADVNQDGNLDVIVNHGWSFSVQFGNGLGGFGSGIFTSICPTPLMPQCNAVLPSIAVDDLNQDGFVDVVVFFKQVPGWFGASRTVYLGNGSGSFAALPSVAGPGTSNAFALGDFNGDTVKDLLFTDPPSSIHLLSGLGGGAFGPAVTASVPAATFGLLLDGHATVGDLNGDGALDLAFPAGGVFLNDGAGGFVPHQTLAVFQSPNQGLAIADLDHDLQKDLVFSSSNGWLSLFHNLTACTGAGWTYGLGCPGTGGFVPSLSARGCSAPGGLLTLSVTSALGGAAAAAFVVSGGWTNIQVGGGCGILVQLPVSFTVPFALGGLPVPGQGRASLTVLLPPTVPLGTTVGMQAAILDPASPFQWSASNGLALTIQ